MSSTASSSSSSTSIPGMTGGLNKSTESACESVAPEADKLSGLFEPTVCELLNKEPLELELELELELLVALAASPPDLALIHSSK